MTKGDKQMEQDSPRGVTLNCIRCDKVLEPATDSEWNQPYAGTAFGSHGHYGSTVFDPMDGTALQINVCDDCLIGAAKRQQVIVCPASSRRGETPTFWHPPEQQQETNDD